MTFTPKQIRIFLASPSDVQSEKSIAIEVIENIVYDPSFVEKIAIRIVAWDKPESNLPMTATMSPQMAITTGLPKPSDCDIVVVLFWSRMGTPLPEQYKKLDGTPYYSGTEWEFEDAMRAAKEFGKPEILIYRKTTDVTLNPADPEFINNYEQWKRVQDFFLEFINPNSGAIYNGVNYFGKPDNFRRMFELHLKNLITSLVNSSDDANKEENTVDDKSIHKEIWQGSPFPGLRSYSEAEAPIFFGRGLETDDLLKQLQNNRFVSVIGVSGSGKSSLVSAGLIPRLRSDGISIDGHGSGDWHIIKFTPDSKPFHQMASALLFGLPSLAGDPIDFTTRKEKLANLLLESPSSLSETVEFALQNESSWVEVLFFIDQFEELFTLCKKEDIKKFVSLISDVINLPNGEEKNNRSLSNRIRFIITIRADFYHKCIQFPELAELFRIGSFPLAAPSQIALKDMIIKPADRALLKFESGLPELILQDTGNEPGSLALVAYTLDELYHAGKESKLLTKKDYDRLGGVKGAIGRRAELVYDKLSSDGKSMLPLIFQNLVSVDHRGIATRERSEYEKISNNDASIELIEAFTKARLLVQSRGEHGALVEVAHEAIFTSWERLSDWIEKTRDDLYILHQLERAAKLWDDKGRSKDFLWLGEKGKELQSVINRLHPNLNTIEKLFARPEQEHLMDELMDLHLSHARRSEIGDRLNIIGDSRPGVGLREDGYPDISWILIPSGEVEIMQRIFFIPSFFISKYPITFRQFQSFINDDNGFKNKIWWKDFPENLQKVRMRDQLYKFSNHPRDNVSWYQAYAFTLWISSNMPEGGFPSVEGSTTIDESWTIRLPTEWEWQQAFTNGEKTKIYPWGNNWEDQRCNSLESGLNRTTAVGIYPAGETELGVADLSGNIREWCLNEYTSLSIQVDKGMRGRVSRGGSYSSVKDFARFNARYCDDPDEQPCDDGFRVVYAPHLGV